MDLKEEWAKLRWSLMGDRHEFKFFTCSCQTSLALAGTGTTAGVALPTAAADVIPESFTSSYMIILIVR
jgi:hypothetical protein